MKWWNWGLRTSRNQCVSADRLAFEQSMVIVLEIWLELLS